MRNYIVTSCFKCGITLAFICFWFSWCSNSCKRNTLHGVQHRWHCYLRYKHMRWKNTGKPRSQSSGIPTAFILAWARVDRWGSIQIGWCDNSPYQIKPNPSQTELCPNQIRIKSKLDPNQVKTRPKLNSNNTENIPNQIQLNLNQFQANTKPSPNQIQLSQTQIEPIQTRSELYPNQSQMRTNIQTSSWTKSNSTRIQQKPDHIGTKSEPNLNENQTESILIPSKW